MNKQTVFVSGSTGFVAQHIIKQLLDTNRYHVIGSFTHIAKAEKLKKDFENNPDLSLVWVPDVGTAGAFDSTFKNHGKKFDYVLHTAAPINLETTNLEKDLIDPAINGARNIFEATLNYAPNIKKFIMTSSYAAIASHDDDWDPSKTFTEDSWNRQSKEEALQKPTDSYYYSKTAAEHEIWDMYQMAQPKFSLTVVNPAFVFGPQCFDSSVKKTLNLTSEFINSVVHSHTEDPINNNIRGESVDVRDVARAHLECITNDKLDGHRLILAEDKFTLQSFVDIINKEYPKLKGHIAKGDEKSADMAMKSLATLDNHVTKDLLGFQFKHLNETVTDTVDQILKLNPIPT